MTEIILSLGDTVANANPTFRFESVRTENYFGSQSSLISMLALGITRQTVTQVYQIVGHIDLLGDPLSLCKSYASGVTNFVVKSSKGHAASGARDLVKGVVGGTAGSVSKITGAMQNLISGFESTTVGKTSRNLLHSLLAIILTCFSGDLILFYIITQLMSPSWRSFTWARAGRIEGVCT